MVQSNAYWSALVCAASRTDAARLRKVQLFGLQLAAAARLPWAGRAELARVDLAVAGGALRGLVYAAPMKALVLRQLTKVYKNGIKALKGIDLDVEEGDFFALLGPNGAGKTTIIGIVTSLVNKTSGLVEVFGHDIDRELEVAKSCIGVVPQEINFNMFETCSRSW